MSDFPCDKPYDPSGFYHWGRDWHSPACRDAAAQGKVPRWTAEDEANLARRVRKLVAKEVIHA